MLSRTADHLFWIARSFERADKQPTGLLASKAHLRAAQVKLAQRAAEDTTPTRAQRAVFGAQGAA